MSEINLIGTVNAFHAALPGMLARRSGRLIAIASTAGHRGYPYVSAYVAAKHAVIGLVRSLALETARSGVTVNAICPGYTDTDMVAGSLDAITSKTGLSRDEALAQLVKANPQGRLIAPDEIAAAVLYLCAEQLRRRHRPVADDQWRGVLTAMETPPRPGARPRDQGQRAPRRP